MTKADHSVGIEIYLPRYLERRSHTREINRVAALLFPRNLFDGLDDRDSIAILLDLLGRKVRVSINAEMVSTA
ncbi:MAG: hypothetical protein Q7T81_15960 [Pseudolabrys sp.]|nr:hypothetical protein [Pseudolabrys sp.]